MEHREVFQLNIGVIGGGAIGLLISAYLAKEHDITVYVRREEQAEAIRKNGILLKEAGQTMNVSSALSGNPGSEDLFIVCVKQSHILSVLPSLKLIGEDTPIIFLQNGMGHIEHVKRLKQPSMLGTVDHGAYKVNDFTVSHTGEGSIIVAPLHKKATNEVEKIRRRLHQPDFIFESQTDWYPMLINKLIVNAVINPVTTLFRVKNGAILENPHIYHIAKEICRETAAVLQLEFDSAWKRVKHVASATRENTSSMLKDILENRKTEIEGITGYILQKNTSLQLPYSTFIYYSIKAIEAIEET